MNSSYICSSCCRRLTSLRSSGVLQRQSRATFISLSNVAPRTTTDKTAKDDPLKLGSDIETSKSRHTAIIPERRKRTPRPERGTSPGDVLESLFEQALKEPPAPPEAPPQPNTFSLSPYKNGETLRNMLESSPVSESWNFFVEKFGPRVPKTSTPSYLYSILSQLLRQITQAKREDPYSQVLPSVTEISKVLLQLKMLPNSGWTDLVSNLLENILKTQQQEEYVEGEEQLLLDLIGAWNVVCRSPGQFQHLPPVDLHPLNWTHLPNISPSLAIRVYKTRGRHSLFGLAVPSFKVGDFSPITVVTLATLGLLTSESDVAKELSVDASPLIVLLSRIASLPNLDISGIAQDEASDTLKEFVQSSWPSLRDRASLLSNSSHPTVGQYDTKSTMQRLQVAMKKGDIREVDELWSVAVQWPVESAQILGESSPTFGTLTVKLCSSFLQAYMTVGQPDRAIDVWNHMVRMGMTPDLVTWNTMLSGCAAKGDWAAVEDLWKKMQALGVKPDRQTWEIRIRTPIECHKFDLGIQALDEMGRTFVAAAKKLHPKKAVADLKLLGQIEGAVKPTIEIINSTVAALLRKGRSQPAYRILSWAANFGVLPDTTTYNILLKPLIRRGHSEEAMAVLQQMRGSGVQADVATFTTVLEGTFRMTEGRTPEEQKALVDSIFSEMEAAGVEPNMHTYGRIIYQLLENSTGDMGAVNAVMEQMVKQGLETSTYIYTILIKHYFEQEPPNLDGVRSIIERASIVSNSVDHIFWDRCIEGYARHGQTLAALKILERLRKAHSKPGWLAMQELLLALARNEQWDFARTLVSDAVRDAGGIASENMKTRTGQRKFWETVIELKLLRPSDVNM